jgi:ribosomal subunit interface protein
MRVIISGRGVVLTPAFKALVEHKVGKLARVLPDARDARLVCQAEKFRRTVRVVVRSHSASDARGEPEGVVRGRRRTFASRATASDLLVAVEDAVETLRRQVREAKARRRHPKRPGLARRGVGPLDLIEPVA